MPLTNRDTKEGFSLGDIKKKLDKIFKNVFEKKGEKDKEEKEKIEAENKEIMLIKSCAEDLWIPKNVVSEYINTLRNFYSPWRIQRIFIMDNNLKKKLWLDKLDFRIDNYTWIILYYIKKLCPNKFKDIAELLLSNSFFRLTLLNPEYTNKKNIWETLITWDENSHLIKNILKFMKDYWDLSYTCLKFCSPFEWSYSKNCINMIKAQDWKEIEKSFWDMSVCIQFFENFICEPESVNLMLYLKLNPQKLKNLWWKEIKEVDLNINSWINFAFRWILEMVKSRPDLNFPKLKTESDTDKKLWKQQREIIIKEYEKTLRNYIAKDKNNISKEKTFNKVFYSMDYENKNLNSSKLPTNWIDSFTWKVWDYSINNKKINAKNPKREIMDHNLKPNLLPINWDIQIKWTWIENEYKTLNEIEKFSFEMGVKEIKKGWYVYTVKFWNLVREKIVKNHIETQKLEVFINGKRIEKKDLFSYENMWDKMVTDIEKYVKEHPNEKILVCIDHHWWTNWASWNGWSKDDRLKIANISPNLKIWSTRCFFWSAITDKDIYNYLSPVSWFSNHSVSTTHVSRIINSGLNKWLWFNELEIYTRLNYSISVTPLTDNMKFKNTKTWKSEIWKIGLAQNDSNWDYELNNYS